jgi:hypothetical protein
MPDRDCQEQIVQVSREKYLMAATLGEQPESEKFVMGGLSATDVSHGQFHVSSSPLILFLIFIIGWKRSLGKEI